MPRGASWRAWRICTTAPSRSRGCARPRGGCCRRSRPPACGRCRCGSTRSWSRSPTGRVDAGLVIHEGRFTFAGYGLERIADLGEHWEAATGLPVPLGVIAAQRAIAPPLRAALQRALAASIDAAFADPRASRAWVESLAQELAPDVIDRHIALYVGDDSRALSANGRAAIETLLQRLGAARAPW
ncbi:MAG: MqnA/MqnD/SBP family protein [Nannocystaceae bacterium]